MVTVQVSRRLLLVLLAGALLVGLGVVLARGSDGIESRDNAAHSPEFLSARPGDELALLTDPIDITVPGHYLLRAGPLDAALPADIEVGGGAFPADVPAFIDVRPDRGLRGGNNIGPHIVEAGGERYAVMGLTVSEVRRPYYGYRAWVSIRQPEQPAG